MDNGFLASLRPLDHHTEAASVAAATKRRPVRRVEEESIGFIHDAVEAGGFGIGTLLGVGALLAWPLVRTKKAPPKGRTA
jgi:hypothetical protein